MRTLTPTSQGTGGRILKIKGAVQQAQQLSNLNSADTHHPTEMNRDCPATVDCLQRWHFRCLVSSDSAVPKCRFGFLKIYLWYQ